MTRHVLEPIHSGDSLFVEITVIDEKTGLPLALDGGEIVESRAEKNGAQVDAICAITDGPNGIFTATWAQGALSGGVWAIQYRVTKGSQRQTVAFGFLTVKPSAFA